MTFEVEDFLRRNLAMIGAAIDIHCLEQNLGDALFDVGLLSVEGYCGFENDSKQRAENLAWFDQEKEIIKETWRLKALNFDYAEYG